MLSLGGRRARALPTLGTASAAAPAPPLPRSTTHSPRSSCPPPLACLPACSYDLGLIVSVPSSPPCPALCPMPSVLGPPPPQLPAGPPRCPVCVCPPPHHTPQGGALLNIQDAFGLGDWAAELIVGAAKLGAFFGTFLGGALMLHYGRRKAIAIDSIFFLIGPLVMAVSAGVA